MRYPTMAIYIPRERPETSTQCLCGAWPRSRPIVHGRRCSASPERQHCHVRKSGRHLASDLPGAHGILIAPDDELEPAGAQGTWQGIDIYTGGTILSARPDTPEAEQTTYTLGLLLDHFSVYAIGSSGPNSFSEFFQSDDAYGPCFLSTGMGYLRNDRCTMGHLLNKSTKYLKKVAFFHFS